MRWGISKSKMSTSDLHAQFSHLQTLWLHSSPEQQLIRFLRNTVSSNPSLSVSSAICLGLGSFRCPRNSYSLDGVTSSPRHFQLREIPTSWDDDVVSSEVENDTSIKPIVEDKAINIPLYQLLIFETVLTTLRQRLVLRTIRFQDPAFTEEDIAFLQERGYEVLRYPPHLPKASYHQHSLDPASLQVIDSATFFFAPSLNRPIVAEVISATNPALYMGHDVLQDASFPFTVSILAALPLLLILSGSILIFFQTFQVMKYKSQLEEYVFSHGWKKLEALGFGDEFGIMWEADLNSEAVLREQEGRLGRMRSLEEEYQRMMERINEAKSGKRVSRAERVWKRGKDLDSSGNGQVCAIWNLFTCKYGLWKI